VVHPWCCPNSMLVFRKNRCSRESSTKSRAPLGFGGSGGFVPGSAWLRERIAKTAKTGITLQNKDSTTYKGPGKRGNYFGGILGEIEEQKTCNSAVTLLFVPV